MNKRDNYITRDVEFFEVADEPAPTSEKNISSRSRSGPSSGNQVPPMDESQELR